MCSDKGSIFDLPDVYFVFIKCIFVALNMKMQELSLNILENKNSFKNVR